jgi:hypothetical protein
VRREFASETVREPSEQRGARDAGGSAAAKLLELQRGAGNAAVARLLGRQPAPAAPDVISGAGENYTIAGMLAKGDYKRAWTAANGLSMGDMLRQMKGAGVGLDDLFKHTAEAAGVDLPRMQWARDIVKDRRIGSKQPDPAQFEEAVRFLVADKPAADADSVFGVALNSIGADAAHKPTSKFRERLKAGEARAREIVARAGDQVPLTKAEWGVDTISSGGGGRHAKGVAVDINYASCPYVIGEAGESALDTRSSGANFDSLADTYDRIAWIARGMRSAINTVISPHAAKTDTTTKGGDTSAQAASDYDALKADSEGMQRYFALVGAPDADLDAALKAVPAGAPAAAKVSALKTADDLRKRIAFDYLTVGGSRANLEALAGGEKAKLAAYKLPGAAPGVKSSETDDQGTAKNADRPFTGGDSTRAPEKGYMNVRKEIVMGLTGVGMRWGATDFGPGASGDIMHFDCDDCR